MLSLMSHVGMNVAIQLYGKFWLTLTNLGIYSVNFSVSKKVPERHHRKKYTTRVRTSLIFRNDSLYETHKYFKSFEQLKKMSISYIQWEEPILPYMESSTRHICESGVSPSIPCLGQLGSICAYHELIHEQEP